jgi:hypothetical protein
MWISRTLFERLLERAAKAEATEILLRESLARQTAHFDWLAAVVNELKLERAALLERCLGLQLAGVPFIQRERTSVALPGADPAYEPATGKLPNIGDVMAKARELADVAKRGGEPETMASTAPGMIVFEDMGDGAAAEAGIRHASDGSVVHTR